jgi:hypothetical protein
LDNATAIENVEKDRSGVIAYGEDARSRVNAIGHQLVRLADR